MSIKTIILFSLFLLCLCSLTNAQPPLAVAATATPSVICEGGQTTLQALPTGGTGTYTYVWESNPPGMPSTPLTTTTYTVTVNDGSETASASVTVVVNHVPGAAGAISGPDTVCEGSSNIPFSVPPVTDATAYYWSCPFGTTLNSCGTNEMMLNIHYGALSGTITVFGSNACGMGSPSPPFLLLVNSSPFVTTSCSQNVISPGGQAFLTSSVIGGSNYYTYAWSPANLVQYASSPSTPTINLVNSTFFIYNVVDNITGCTAQSNLAVIVCGGPLTSTIIADTNVICENSYTRLHALPNGGLGVYSYQWSSVPAGFVSTDQNPIVSPSVTTQYIVFVDDANALSTSSVTVQVVPAPLTLGAITGLTDVCMGTNNVVYTVPTAPTITHYFWNLPAGVSIVSGQSTNSIVVNYGPNAVSGNITVMGSGACGCVPSDTLVVTLHSTPVADAGPNQNINCGGVPLTIGTAAVSGMTYSWSPSYALSNPNIAQPTAAPWGNTTYILSVTDTSTGCYATDTVSITVVGAPVADAGLDQSINCGGPGVVIGTQLPYVNIYSWTPSIGLSDDSIAQPTATPTTTTSYVLTVLDLATGCFGTDNVTVTVNLAPIADAGQNQTIVFGDNVWLYGSATGGSGNYSYYWMPDTLLPYPNLQNAITMPLFSPVVFTLLVTDSVTGCIASDSVLVDVIVSTEALSDSFTAHFYPNPTSGIVTVEMSSKPSEHLALKVFNPIGKLVYKTWLTNDMRQHINLSTLPDGLYFITIEARTLSVTKKVVILKN